MSVTRRRYLERVGCLGGAATAGVLGGCTSNGQRGSDSVTVRIGSKPFIEQRILGYLAYERLRTADQIRAVDDIGDGDSLSNWEATSSGDRHLYWEYTATAWARLPPRRERRITDAGTLFQRVRSDARSRGVRMAEPAPFSNEYVIVADKAWAEAIGVSTISELAAYFRNADGDPGIALNEAFYHRPDGWHGLLSRYGVSSDGRDSLESGTFIVTSVGLTYELLERGSVRVANGFATDPQLDRSTLTVLEDDREYFLPYQPAPTASAPMIEAHPEVFDRLSPVVTALDRPAMRRLNGRVLLHGDNPFAVAKEFENEVVDDDA